MLEVNEDILAPFITERLLDALVVMNENFDVIYFNKSAEKLYEITREECIGRRQSSLWQFEFLVDAKNLDHAKRARNELSVIGDNDIWQEIMRITTRTGKQIIVLYRIIALSEFNGERMYISTAQDFTKQYEEQEKYKMFEIQLNTIFQSMREGFIVVNSNGEIILNNKSANDILGINVLKFYNKSVTGETWELIDEHKNSFPKENFISKKIVVEKISYRKKTIGIKYQNSRIKWLLLNTNPVINSDFQALEFSVITFIDISEKIELEERLELEREKQQKLINEAFIFGQERERKELSMELHDNVNQLLAAAAIHIGFLKNKAEAKMKTGLDEAVLYIKNATSEIRKISKYLALPVLEYESLIRGIRQLLDDMFSRGDINFTISVVGFTEDDLKEEFKLNLFRIIQEQANNTIKHSQAKHFLMEIIREDQSISATLKDDGKGCDLSVERNGIGLKNIEQRIKLYDGKLSIISAPNEGFMMNIIFPLNHALKGKRE
ncbi:MAG: PAS domain S-box protein [Bacteroidota bacterium]|nr:PAS domain S-box protein [Bacteroidota bacterium]